MTFLHADLTVFEDHKDGGDPQASSSSALSSANPTLPRPIQDGPGDGDGDGDGDGGGNGGGGGGGGAAPQGVSAWRARRAAAYKLACDEALAASGKARYATLAEVKLDLTAQEHRLSHTATEAVAALLCDPTVAGPPQGGGAPVRVATAEALRKRTRALAAHAAPYLGATRVATITLDDYKSYQAVHAAAPAHPGPPGRAPDSLGRPHGQGPPPEGDQGGDGGGQQPLCA